MIQLALWIVSIVVVGFTAFAILMWFAGVTGQLFEQIRGIIARKAPRP